MNCVESGGGGGSIDPPLRLRVTFFSRRLLGLSRKIRVVHTDFGNERLGESGK